MWLNFGTCIAPRLEILILISGEASPVHGLEDSIVKMTICKLIYRFNIIPIPAAVFVEVDKLIIRCMCKCKGFKVAIFLKRMKWEDLHYWISKITINDSNQNSLVVL